MTKSDLPESFPYTTVQIYQYLYKIGFPISKQDEKFPQPTLDTLSGILTRHLKSIPFGGLNLNYFTIKDTLPTPIVNTLDPYSTRGVSVDPNAIFDKLMYQAREGYCFEHAILLRNVLEFLGYTGFATFARILDPVDFKDFLDISHCVLVVTIQSRQYLVDAGFSHFSTLRPVPLNGEIVECEGSVGHRIQPHPNPHTSIPGFRLESRIKDKPWRTVHTFHQIPYFHQDIESLNFGIVHSPSKVFHQHLILDILVDDGYISIFDQHLTIRIHGDIILQLDLNSELERRLAFKNYFRIDLPSEYQEHLPSNLKSIMDSIPNPQSISK